MVVWTVPSLPIKFITVNSSWFTEFVTKGLGSTNDCYIAKISHDFLHVTLLGTSPPSEPDSIAVVNISPDADRSDHVSPEQ